MNTSITLDEKSQLRGRPKNEAVQAFRTDRTPISLPKKDELLLLLHLKRIHEDRQKLPEQEEENGFPPPFIRIK